MLNIQAKTINQCAELLKQEDYNPVIKKLTPIVNKQPQNFHALQLLGLAHYLAGESQNAIELLEKALAINSNFPAVQHNAAGIYRSLGDMQKAEESYRKAIDLKPDYAEAYQGLAEIIRFQSTDSLIPKINKQLTKKPDDNLARYFHFTLGKIYDDCSKYNLAFKHYKIGNQLSHKNWPAKKNERYLQSIRDFYSTDYFQKNNISGSNTKFPIFIIGLPRSGSTLVEQILSSHSGVFAAGEISDIQNISDQIQGHIKSKLTYPKCMADISEEACKGLGKAYIKRLKQIDGFFPEAIRGINKNLSNFSDLGLISSLLPNSFIIHTQRHPLDCCISSYFQNFSKGIEWSFDLDSIINQYKNYDAMIKHWRKVLPIKILDIRYENLITDFDNISKNIISFCQLPWEESCLEFHNNKRPVNTASVWQVRQPIYQRSKARWKQYENHINSLKEGLADYIKEYETT